MVSYSPFYSLVILFFSSSSSSWSIFSLYVFLFSFLPSVFVHTKKNMENRAKQRNPSYANVLLRILFVVCVCATETATAQVTTTTSPPSPPVTTGKETSCDCTTSWYEFPDVGVSYWDTNGVVSQASPCPGGYVKRSAQLTGSGQSIDEGADYCVHPTVPQAECTIPHPAFTTSLPVCNSQCPAGWKENAVSWTWFSVQGVSDVHVSLVGTSTVEESLFANSKLSPYELVLAPSQIDPTLTSICLNRFGKPQPLPSNILDYVPLNGYSNCYRITTPILSYNKYTLFWISWSDGVIRLGRGRVADKQTLFLYNTNQRAINVRSLAYGVNTLAFLPTLPPTTAVPPSPSATVRSTTSAPISAAAGTTFDPTASMDPTASTTTTTTTIPTVPTDTPTTQPLPTLPPASTMPPLAETWIDYATGKDSGYATLKLTNKASPSPPMQVVPLLEQSAGMLLNGTSSFLFTVSIGQAETILLLAGSNVPSSVTNSNVNKIEYSFELRPCEPRTVTMKRLGQSITYITSPTSAANPIPIGPACPAAGSSFWLSWDVAVGSITFGYGSNVGVSPILTYNDDVPLPISKIGATTIASTGAVLLPATFKVPCYFGTGCQFVAVNPATIIFPTPKAPLASPPMNMFTFTLGSVTKVVLFLTFSSVSPLSVSSSTELSKVEYMIVLEGTNIKLYRYGVQIRFSANIENTVMHYIDNSKLCLFWVGGLLVMRSSASPYEGSVVMMYQDPNPLLVSNVFVYTSTEGGISSDRINSDGTYLFDQPWSPAATILRVPLLPNNAIVLPQAWSQSLEGSIGCMPANDWLWAVDMSSTLIPNPTTDTAKAQAAAQAANIQTAYPLVVATWFAPVPSDADVKLPAFDDPTATGQQTQLRDACNQNIQCHGYEVFKGPVTTGSNPLQKVFILFFRRRSIPVKPATTAGSGQQQAVRLPVTTTNINDDVLVWSTLTDEDVEGEHAASWSDRLQLLSNVVPSFKIGTVTLAWSVTTYLYEDKRGIDCAGFQQDFFHVGDYLQGSYSNTVDFIMDSLNMWYTGQLASISNTIPLHSE